jgi:hypothetical protein
MNASEIPSQIGSGVSQSVNNAVASGLGLLGVLCIVFLISFFYRKM